MRIALIALTAALAVSGCALKKKDGYTVADASTNPDLICERVSIPGKIYPGKICMTAEQWERHEKAGENATGDAQRSALRAPAPGQGG